jgi:hypothetical protein
VKDFIEDLIADSLRARVLNQGECEPLAHHWKMTPPEQLERRIRHGIDVRPNQIRIIICPRSIGTCHKNHQRLRHDNQDTPRSLKSQKYRSTRFISCAEAKIMTVGIVGDLSSGGGR